ncbi:DUF7344 domain-containing protein [Haloterrigena gelatinilytica]
MPSKTHAERCDRLLQLLCHHHRRQTLRFLERQPNNTATIDELLAHLDSLQDGASVSGELHHVHLPKLDESTLIEWDSRSETIRYYPNPLCEELLHTLSSHNVQSSSV